MNHDRQYVLIYTSCTNCF